MKLFAGIAAAVRRWLSRRAARRLLAQGLPRGIQDAPLLLPEPPLEPRPLLQLRRLPSPVRDAGVVRAASFRLDSRTYAPANAGILPPPRRDPALRWVSPALRREKIELPWMAQHRIRFLGPLQAEWFALWWTQNSAHSGGAKDPVDYDLPRELGWAMENCKEQMLIRRDVKKDEAPPEPQKLEPNDVGPGMAAAESVPLTEVIPEKSWVEPARMLNPLPLDSASREAWLQRRALLHALDDR